MNQMQDLTMYFMLLTQKHLKDIFFNHKNYILE